MLAAAKALCVFVCLSSCISCVCAIDDIDINTPTTNNYVPTFKVAERSHNRKDTVISNTTMPKKRLKILVHSPRLGWSHSQFLCAVAGALVDAGHEVHMLSYSLNTLMGDETDCAETQKFIWHERPVDKRDSIREQALMSKFFDGPQGGNWDMTRHSIKVFAESCRDMLENKELLTYLRAERYDFGISEAYSACPFGIFAHVGIKATAGANAVAVSSVITSIFGIPSFSSFVYDMMVSASVDPLKMNFFERAANFFADVYTYFTIRNVSFDFAQPIFDAALGASSPSLRDTLKNISLAFVNSKEFFSLPRPLSHKIHYIGGIAERKKNLTRVLPENFKSIIDAAPEGVVLFSFGTVVETRQMTVEMKQNFADAFAKFPGYAFIWKLDLVANESMKLPPNVHIFDWVPQDLILAHPRTKVFISHCGMNSANEAATLGVPVLGIPLFGDQSFNIATIVNKGFGLAVDIRDVARSGRVIEEALRRLLSDARFGERARLIARKLALAPFSARERLVKWVEFAAEFDDLNELNMPTEDEMSILSYYSLDVILAALVAFVLAVCLTIGFLALVLRKMFTISKQKTL